MSDGCTTTNLVTNRAPSDTVLDVFEARARVKRAYSASLLDLSPPSSACIWILSGNTPDMASTENVTVPFFKKKGRGRPATTRKRSQSPPASVMTVPVPSSSKSEVVLPSRKQGASLLSAGTKRTSSQREEDEERDART
ncbi:hypothetical protein C8T65DRAFT_741023 [Cerioporus squamosus]|nr:hypothetical protein C8T65DRAFT_741023 [Cerioporus squamosus]